MDNLDHYYRVLGLKPTASVEELRLAYRDLAQVWHPDRFQGNARLREKATDRLREINEAYHALCRLDERETPTASGAESPLPAGRRPRFGRAVRFYRPRSSPWPFFRPRFLSDSTRFAALCFLAVMALVFTVLLVSGYIYRMVQIPVASGDFVMQDALRRAGVRPPDLTPLTWPQIPRIFDVRLPDAPVVQPPPADVKTGDPDSQRPKSTRVSHPAFSLISNGADLIPVRNRTGVGTLRIANRTHVDAVASFATVQHSKTPMRMVYVRASNEAFLADIGPGNYLVTFHFGGRWLPGEFRFAEGRFSSGPFGPFTFWGIEDAHGLRSDHYEIVLKPQ